MSDPKADSEGNINLIKAAMEKGVKKFLLVTSIGTGDSKDAPSEEVYNVLKPVLLEKEKAEDELMVSNERCCAQTDAMWHADVHQVQDIIVACACAGRRLLTACNVAQNVQLLTIAATAQCLCAGPRQDDLDHHSTWWADKRCSHRQCICDG